MNILQHLITYFGIYVATTCACLIWAKRVNKFLDKELHIAFWVCTAPVINIFALMWVIMEDIHHCASKSELLTMLKKWFEE